MTGAEEQQPLHDGQASGSEALLDGSRLPKPKVGLVVVAVALMALAYTAVIRLRKPSAVELPAHDVSPQHAFLSEVLLDRKSDTGSGKTIDQSDGKSAISSDVSAKPKEQVDVTPQQVFKWAGMKISKAAELKGQASDLENGAQEAVANSESLKKQVVQTRDEATTRRQDAEKARSDAEEARAKADALLKEAVKSAKDAQEEADKAASAILEEARKKVEQMHAKANGAAKDLGNKAKQLDAQAANLDKNAVAKDDIADGVNAKAEILASKAHEMNRQSEQDRTNALNDEKQARWTTASQRLCINLPGVKLKGNIPSAFDPVVGDHKVTDDWQCNDWCLNHAECKQSVFTWETKTCELFKEATAEPLVFRETWPWFNSSYCDTYDQKQTMLDRLHQVYDLKPWVPPLHNCSWGGDNCLHTGCCADHCDASFDFKTCKEFTCYKRDEYFAGCRKDVPPANWDGTKLGGHAAQEIAAAPDGKMLQGTRLYCFTVVMWSQPAAEAWQNSEAELVNNWKKQKKGIMECDDYSLFDGIDGGSVHNIQSFIRAWNMVKDDGRWKRNDWTIKVDPDAVFLPSHFRNKVVWQWKPPQGATIYLRNTFYKFQFLGALEAMTREAAEVYFGRSWECEAHLGQEGGEDYWMLQCLEGLGMDFITDTTLLHDKYAADENCYDPYSVAHHFFKKVKDWNGCWEAATTAWNNEHPE